MARFLIERLEDPFAMFPVRGVFSQLAASLSDSEEALYAKMGHWGVSRKFWSVEEEHWYECVGLLIGASFVLSQAVLTQSVSLVLRIRRETGVAGIPDPRDAILSWKADSQQETGLSKLLIVDAGANYIKHHYEWPEDWEEMKCSRAQQRTIATLRRFELAPGYVTDNMHALVRALGFSVDELPSISDSMQSWRERVATELRTLLPKSFLS